MEEEGTRPGFASESFKNLQFLHHKEQRRCLTLKNGPMEQASERLGFGCFFYSLLFRELGLC